MSRWDVLAPVKSGGWTQVGSVHAPDLEMALLLAREGYFRHREASDFAVRSEGTDAVERCPDPTGIGGVLDRAYRRPDGYAGVGARFKRIAKELSGR